MRFFSAIVALLTLFGAGRCQLSTVNYQLHSPFDKLRANGASFIGVNCQLSTVNCHLPPVHRPLPTLHSPLSTLHSQLSIIFAGDLLLDRGVRAAIRRHGADALFDGVRGMLRGADFAVANLECPITDRRTPLRKKYRFRAEPEWTPALRAAGLTHLSMANNHSNDQGRDELVTTARHLRENGLTPLGFGMTQVEARRPVVLERNGIRVAVFAAVLVPLENWMYRDDLPGPNQSNADTLAADIRAWKRANQRGVAVAYLHWGREYERRPTAEQVQDAHALVDAGADAVIGHHPHVTQTVEKYHGKTIVYSLGNFVFDQYKAPANTAAIAELTVDEFGNTRVRLNRIAIGKRGVKRIEN